MLVLNNCLDINLALVAIEQNEIFCNNFRKFLRNKFNIDLVINIKLVSFFKKKGLIIFVFYNFVFLLLFKYVFLT